MPVPKRKTSKSRRDSRSSTKFIRPHAITKCLNCEHALNPHEVCKQCGYYKGVKVLTTKLERTLKRSETRSVMQAKYNAKVEAQQAAEKAAQENSK